MTILSTEASESGRFRSADQVIELDSRTHSCAIGAGAAVQEPPAPTKVRKEEPLLILDGLSCEYDGRTILDSLQGVLHRGEAAVLTGDNGSGKTTLLRHLAGLQAVLPGCARFLGRDLTEETPETLFPAIGTVFQNPDAQLFHLTVTAEIAYGPKNAARSGRDSEHVINTEALIETLGLGAITDRHPHTLPRGKRQLVACAAAMAAAPQLLLMDEPLRCLDPEDADRLLALLHTMKHSGTAMIIVDHASPRLRSLADSRWRLENGALSITPFAGGSGADI